VNRSNLYCLVAGLLCSTSLVFAGPPAATAAKANAAPEEIQIPKSVFAMPRTPQEGRDPFFPHSQYPYDHPQPVVAPTNPAPPVVQVDLKLKGFSGPIDHRLAIINNHTFEAGEEAEVVTTNAGRMRIRCLEIKNDGVIIQVGPERRELRLRGGI